jgi:hypothetical protein
VKAHPIGFVLAVAAFAATGSACGSSSGKSGTSSSGGSSGSDAGSEAGLVALNMCAPANGTYAVTYTAEPTDAGACPPASTYDDTVTFPGDAGAKDGGPPTGCSCSGATLACMATRSGEVEKITFDITPTGYSGSLVVTSDAGTCGYTFIANM